MSLTFQKFEKVFNISIIIFLASIITLVLTDILITSKVDIRDSTEVEIHFKEIVREKIEGKISYSFSLYNLDNNEFYKISADNTDCFDLEGFLQNVKEGDLIIVYLNKHTGLKNPNLKSVIGIVVKGKNYIDTICINDKIESNKIYLPLMFSILPIIVIISIFHKKRKITEKEKTNS